MDQSRPWYQGLKSPLIERADLQSPRQRTLYGGLTLAFWLLWLYLWVPVLALLAWTLGVQQAYKYMIELEGYREVIRVIGMYSLVILLLSSALLLWAGYNILRFRGVEKRTAAPPVTVEQMGLAFGQDPDAVTSWQGKQRLLVTHDDEGRIARVDALGDGEPVPA